MQLFEEGKLQGITVNAIPKSERPPALDGTLVGDVGFDPLLISSQVDLRWLREAELKHGRVTMLATLGLLVQDVYQFPGVTSVFGDLKVTALHDAAVQQGAMQQLLLWIGLLEVFSGVAIIQTLQGSDRQPGDFGFDPLGLVPSRPPEARPPTPPLPFPTPPATILIRMLYGPKTIQINKNSMFVLACSEMELLC